MALLKNRSITRITTTASASAAVRCESRFRNFTGGHSFAMYRISVTFRPPPAGVFTVVSPSQTITADLPPSKLVGERAARDFQKGGRAPRAYTRASRSRGRPDHKAVMSRLIVPERRARIQSGDVRVEFVDALPLGVQQGGAERPHLHRALFHLRIHVKGIAAEDPHGAVRIVYKYVVKSRVAEERSVAHDRPVFPREGIVSVDGENGVGFCGHIVYAPVAVRHIRRAQILARAQPDIRDIVYDEPSFERSSCRVQLTLTLALR